ncbi:SDR family NAD(P)-dependent oxidoreductase [Thermomonas sp.]|uniref:SDR family NAD(P)-dependent oxidoreductase n=1 Tax=Thermomonas sp. TaxID=1971895 RepID=UPI002486E48D|nr:SDR family NAD(P)-dependent oxidoreductase [Thermomonas sp.]MDI1254091.1 SDR family NAD(P)-dependent oxidoreductase [Thermomonas sp.]
MIDLTGRVAIVTGAGGGLGRLHALLLAQRGAKVVVNDLGEAANAVVAEIVAAGGQARAAICSVTDAEAVQAMVDGVLADWGRIDILVNNAGILRDKSFAKMSLADFRVVVDVHLMGSVHCTKAVWDSMRERGYGRIVMTTSSSGLYGNFGQANYGAAKMALVGLMQTLAIEGAKYDIRVNCLAPTAATQMMEGILPAGQLALLLPELVSPAVLALVSEQAPTRAILCAGAGGFELAQVTLTQGVFLPGDAPSAEDLLAQWAQLANRDGEMVPPQGFDQARHELCKAGFDFAGAAA